MAGKKQMPAADEEAYDDEECYNEEGEEEEGDYDEGDVGAEDEESGHGENAHDDDDRVLVSTQLPPAAHDRVAMSSQLPTTGHDRAGMPSQLPMADEGAAARRVMLAVPLDMSLYRTSWTIVVRPPHVCLFKKGVAPSGMDVLENVGVARYLAVTKKNDAQGKSLSIVNIWAKKNAVISRFGLQRKMFMANEVRDPGNRITAGKFRNAPDAVRDHTKQWFDLVYTADH
jgi:hypothetical protein